VCRLVTDSALAVFRSRKRRLPVTPAPVRPGSCTVDLLCGGVPLPGRTISQPCRLLQSGNAPGVRYPSQFCSCPRVRLPFGVVGPPAVCRASHPDNLVGGSVAQMPHPLRCATDRGLSPRLLGFVPASKPFPPDLAPDGSILPWACASLRSSDTGNTGMPARHFSARRSASHGCRSRHPDAHGFCWRCRCAANSISSFAPLGCCLGASPADPSAFVAGA
jgi:hypothetical protein